MEIKTLKLKSSEEIIGRLETTDRYGTVLPSSIIRMSKIRLIVPMQDGAGGIAPMLMPWILSNVDGEVDIDVSSVAAQVTPVREMEDVYLSKTTTIQLHS